MKLNGPNEPLMFTNSILGNYSFNVYATETCFGEFHVEIVEETLTYSWKFPHIIQLMNYHVL